MIPEEQKKEYYRSNSLNYLFGKFASLWMGFLMQLPIILNVVGAIIFYSGDTVDPGVEQQLHKSLIGSSIVALLGAALIWRFHRSKHIRAEAQMDEEKIVISNGIKKFTFKWEEVTAISRPRLSWPNHKLEFRGYDGYFLIAPSESIMDLSEHHYSMDHFIAQKKRELNL